MKKSEQNELRRYDILQILQNRKVEIRPIQEVSKDKSRAHPVVNYALFDSSVGKVLVGCISNGVCWVAVGEEDALLGEMEKYLCGLKIKATQGQEAVKAVLGGEKIIVFAHGTPFQNNIWKLLLDIKAGSASSYKDIAMKIGEPKMARAVGNAVGKNKIAILIPCHRVIRLDGRLGGYRWGVDVKERIMKMEGARVIDGRVIKQDIYMV